MKDSGPGAVSAADVTVLDNALGYVLNQGGTAQFSPYNQKAYDFSLDYALVTLPGVLTGEQAKEFFDHLGTIDPALWSGTYAGFTQIDAANSPLNNSMLFLKPAAPKREFIDGLYAAATTTPYATYTPLGNNGQPTTAKAGIAFPSNDWIAYPNGDGYLVNLGNPSAALLTDLASFRRQHRRPCRSPERHRQGEHRSLPQQPVQVPDVIGGHRRPWKTSLSFSFGGVAPARASGTSPLTGWCVHFFRGRPLRCLRSSLAPDR
jgi:hypothetical protein